MESPKGDFLSHHLKGGVEGEYDAIIMNGLSGG
jgi:hypothetical protein